MLRFGYGFFLVLHGLVHLLYFGQSRRIFELRSGMNWSDQTWVFSRFLGIDLTRSLASLACLAAALGFVMGGFGVFLEQSWWQPVVISAAVFSVLLYFGFWDGKFRNLDDQGGIGILIDLALLVALLAFQWPDFGF